ncbi:SMI1/KNR4 family protein [Escherichia coli]|uniref:SMI1/KNR4 family protein n=2 Tax=Escherichia coli TaxID=562 RepID=UPI000B491643|nr:SMI1/KNR4 family protein [Escherichia coli]EDH5633285.1 SMI1/KNR4 family protein [Salmonella enterica subsp. enterica serovar Claibornei]EER2598432.1 SMI1/KNR4 family protein [Escherichia coli]EEW8586347.1 SMI1/KNR4 family protein [Escherichia coli]EEZ2132604.1 SMI1/KNR4 family protein [Escherichia coli]EFC0633044.1 SMI1/KNR4 family protein [Escherichia coli]
MNQELLERVRKEITSDQDMVLYGIPASDEDITHAENILNIKFNDQYIQFIKLFGGAFGGISIHAFNNGSLIGNATVIDLTKKFRETYSDLDKDILNSFYAVSDDGSGNPILMNTDGEIFIFLHDSYEIEYLYSSLEELLMKSFPSKN